MGEHGVQLQPLVDALASEILKNPVLRPDKMQVAMLRPAHLRDGKTHMAYRRRQ